MSIIISHKSIKRTLEAPFGMCGKADELAAIGREITRQAESLETYGWIRIDLTHPCDAPANTKSLAWTDASNINPPA